MTDNGAPIRVVVADDQTVVREGLVLLLGLLPGTEVVASAADGAEAVRLVAEHAPDVVLMDLRMPRTDGVEATRLITGNHPGTGVVVLTTYSDDASVLDAPAPAATSPRTPTPRRSPAPSPPCATEPPAWAPPPRNASSPRPSPPGRRRGPGPPPCPTV